MNKHKSILLSALMLIFVSSFVMSVYAATPSLASGYAVTSNYHGIDVPPGTEITITAYTTNPDVTQVTFIWRDGAKQEQYTSTDTVREVTSDNGQTVYYFESKYTPNTIGDWGVQALFQGEGGTTKQQIEDVIAIRAASFNAVPEIPIIGTIGAAAAMIAGFAWKMKRKPLK